MTREYLEGSHRLESDYATYLEERYQGEVYGEALFKTMASACSHPERARKLRRLEQLERETKDFLLPLVKGVGYSGEESAARIAEGEQLGGQLANAPWADLMKGFVPELERFVQEFEQAEALAPPGKESEFRHVTAHERALLEFSQRELSGDEQGSLDAVLALLREPPSA